MQKRIADLTRKIMKASTERGLLIEEQERQTKRLEELQQQTVDIATAKDIVLAVAQQTQMNIGVRISDLVSLALSSVFPDPYQFKVEFVQRRGTTEVDLRFVRNEAELEPLSASGGGAIDIASFALRLAVWSLTKGTPVFILDEPFRNLSQDRHEQAGLMLKKLSEILGIQIIMVSHNKDIISGADRVFRLGNNTITVE